MKHLKSFNENLSNADLEHLKDTYLDLCDMLEDVQEIGVTVRIQTGSFFWGILQRKAVDNFVEFCNAMKQTTYYLQFEFNNSEIATFREKNNGEFPKWFIEDLKRVQDYLKLEDWNTKIEILRPNPKTEYDIIIGKDLPQSKQVIVFANLDEINKWFKDTLSIFIIFSKTKNNLNPKRNWGFSF